MARRRHARNFLCYQTDLLDRISEAYEDLAPELEDRSRALRDCLKAVQGRAGELLRLRYEDGLEPKSIAGRVGMAVVAVRVMLSRTRALLRECIERKINPRTSSHE
jgi:DNA-directed RNA polymerase specialized sigma24 family protein